MKYRIFLTHLVINIFMQGELANILLWARDCGVQEYILLTLFYLICLLADYFLISKVLRKSEELNPKKYHLFDLVCAIPNMLMVVAIIFQLITRPSIEYRVNYIASVLIAVSIEVLLITERIILIKKE